YRVRDKHGATRWLYDITLVERDEGGAITHYVGYVLDRTERQHADEQRRGLEERLQQAQRLESLGVLAGGIAHDFNNLLVGILGNASLARERMERTDANRELVDSIEQAARHAGDLTHQMLAYAGKAYVAFQLVDLNALIAELAGLLRASVSKKATFELRVAPVAPRVVGDAAQLDQVVMNLVTNASDALGDAPGAIVLSTGETDLTSADVAELYGAPNLGSGRYAYVEVSDDGCGMDAATRARMFEPFFTTKFAGRGLGLAAVLGIARGHRGGIAVDSSPGVGTRVRVYVPVAAADAPVSVARPKEAPIAELPRTPVLVVDDEPAVQKLAARVVRGHGLQVLVASDGEQALELHARHGAEIGCVLLDLTMPKLSGAETFKALRERTPDLPIVVTSGYSESDALEQLDARNGTLFLQKPFTPADLVARLASALGET
ncbi:MAG: response regulator, partial [Planctomycetes bacterium]|nr:response regulator [Planctomycetota bacterium]